MVFTDSNPNCGYFCKKKNSEVLIGKILQYLKKKGFQISDKIGNSSWENGPIDLKFRSDEVLNSL